MTTTIVNAGDVLRDAGYSIGMLQAGGGGVTTFENNTVLGFILNYPSPGVLLSKWKEHTAQVLSVANLPLRRAGTKAWNTYFIILADSDSNYAETVAIGEIESDLVGTRKIAQAGVKDLKKLETALLPLLPIKNPPQLVPIDILSEIRLRTTQLDSELIETFLSNASVTTMLQMLGIGS